MFLRLVADGHLMLFVTRTRGAFWTTLSKYQAFLCNCRDVKRRGVHVQPGLARAGAYVENHRLCLGLQPRLDDPKGHRETGALWSPGSSSFLEEIVFQPLQVSTTRWP